MKHFLFFLLLLPLTSLPQKIKVNEYDKFIKQRRIESYPLTIKAASNIKMDVAFSAIGSSYYLQLSGMGIGTNVIGMDDKVILLLDNDSTITAKSTGMQTYDITKTPNTYQHDYSLLLPDLQSLSRHSLQALRKYHRDNFDDIYISKENGDKVKRLSALLMEEIRKANAPQIVQAIDLKNIANHIGDSVTVVGMINSGSYLPGNKDAPTLLHVGVDFSNQLLTVVIRGADRKNFDAEPEHFYQGKLARITGRVQLNKEKPQIIISKKEQIAVMADTESLAKVKTGQSGAQPVKKEEVTKVPAQPPGFPGGREVLLNFLNRNLKPPAELEAGEEKTVTVQFLVSADGAVSNFKITQSAGPSFDNEVLRVLKRMPKWKPAIENGRPVDAVITQPVTFFRSNASAKIQD